MFLPTLMKRALFKLSYALNHAGGPILQYAYPDPTLHKGKVNAYQGRMV